MVARVSVRLDTPQDGEFNRIRDPFLSESSEQLMTGKLFRGTFALLGAALALVGQPGESQAFFHSWCGGCGSNTTYRPYSVGYAGTACSPCNTGCNTGCSPCQTACSPCQQVCNYVPQTCYRTVYSQVPVTCYHPVTTCDPCTGCPRTCMRPVTTYVCRPQVVPFTTYRPVYSSMCSTSPCATGSCGTTVSYAPGISYAPASGCSSCGTGSSYLTPSYAAPAASAPAYAAPSLSPTPSYSAPSLSPAPSASAPSLAPTPSTSAPSLEPPASSQPSLAPEGNAPSTFREESTNPNSTLRPIPDPGSDNRATKLQSPPRLLDPKDRTTALPIQRASTIKPIGANTHVKAIPVVSGAVINANPQTVDDGGWRSARSSK